MTHIPSPPDADQEQKRHAPAPAAGPALRGIPGDGTGADVWTNGYGGWAVGIRLLDAIRDVRGMRTGSNSVGAGALD